MEFDPQSEFEAAHERETGGLEQELREVLARHPAPPGLKRKVMERRAARLRLARGNTLRRIAAGIVLAAVAGGAADWAWRGHEERRKGEEARRQVMLALRITGHALNQVQVNLAAHDRPED